MKILCGKRPLFEKKHIFFPNNLVNPKKSCTFACFFAVIYALVRTCAMFRVARKGGNPRRADRKQQNKIINKPTSYNAYNSTIS